MSILCTLSSDFLITSHLPNCLQACLAAPLCARSRGTLPNAIATFEKPRESLHLLLMIYDVGGEQKKPVLPTLLPALLLRPLPLAASPTSPASYDAPPTPSRCPSSLWPLSLFPGSHQDRAYIAEIHPDFVDRAR